VPCHRFMSLCDSSFVNFRRYNFKFKFSFMRSCIIYHGVPSFADQFCFNFWGELSTEMETAALIKCIFHHLLRSKSLTLPVVNTCFSQSSSVTFCGSALLNYSQNIFIPWSIVWPGCGLSCTHTLAVNQSPTEYLLVLAVVTTQLTLFDCALQACMTDTTFKFHSQCCCTPLFIFTVYYGTCSKLVRSTVTSLPYCI
jgi:hypothetical protein